MRARPAVGVLPGQVVFVAGIGCEDQQLGECGPRLGTLQYAEQVDEVTIQAVVDLAMLRHFCISTAAAPPSDSTYTWCGGKRSITQLARRNLLPWWRMTEAVIVMLHLRWTWWRGACKLSSSIEGEGEFWIICSRLVEVLLSTRCGGFGF